MQFFRFFTLFYAILLCCNVIAAPKERIAVFGPSGSSVMSHGSPPPPATKDGLTLMILGMYPEMTAGDAKSIVEKTLLPNGYTSTQITRTDTCEGKLVVGESAPYVSQVTLTKAADNYIENVIYDLSPAYYDASILKVSRIIRYPTEATAMLADAWLQPLLKRFGAPLRLVADNGSTHPSRIIWRDPGKVEDMIADIHYFSSQPDRISAFEISISLSQANYDYVKGKSNSVLCDATKQIDAKKQRGLDSQQPPAPPKF